MSLDQVFLNGARERALEWLELRAGPLSMHFCPQDAFLRRVCVHGRDGTRHEVLRGIYAAVRNHNWATIRPRVDELEVERREGGFRVSFRAICCQREIDYVWRGEIVGSPEGTVEFSFDGEARSAFRRNRIGFCVLHPPDCAGRPCRLRSVDGSERSARFPDAISPHQPFQDLRSIAHEIDSAGTVQIELEGDVFETEDQRNWTDASYKTYCTPLELPFPVDVNPGDRVSQRVTLRFLLDASHAVSRRATTSTGGETRAVELTVEPNRVARVPRIGIACASDGALLSQRETALLAHVGLSHLRVDLDAGSSDVEATWTRAADQARACDVSLEVALFLGDEPRSELGRLRYIVDASPAEVARWIVLPRQGVATRASLVESAREALGDVARSSLFGGGTNAFFTELNRNRPPIEALDFVAYSLNPQVHAFDDASMVETLSVQRTTVESARGFCGELPISVTPVTLRPRFNPNATTPQEEAEGGELPGDVDPRQLSLFGAAWTLGSLKHLAEAACASVTYYETTGWRGVLERETGSADAERFPSTPGAVFPLYHALADVAPLAGNDVLETTSSEPLEVECLALRRGAGQRILIANYTDSRRRVRLRGGGLDAEVRIWKLDATTREPSTREPQVFRQTPTESQAPRGESGELEFDMAPCSVWRLDTSRSTEASDG